MSGTRASQANDPTADISSGPVTGHYTDGITLLRTDIAAVNAITHGMTNGTISANSIGNYTLRSPMKLTTGNGTIGHPTLSSPIFNFGIGDLSPSALDMGSVRNTDGDPLRGQVLFYLSKSSNVTAEIVGDPRFSIEMMVARGSLQVLTINPFGNVSIGGYLGSITVQGGGPVQAVASQVVEVHILFTPEVNDSQGTRAATLRIIAPGGSMTAALTAEIDLTSALSVYITPVKVSIPQTGKVSVSARFFNNGPATNIQALPQGLPSGISIEPFELQVSAASQASASLTFNAAKDALAGFGQIANISFSAFGKFPACFRTIYFDVFSSAYEFPWSGSAGKVTVETSLVIMANGTWSWIGTLNDNSTFAGDKYFLEVGLPYKDPISGGFIFQYISTYGTLGAGLSGPAVSNSFALAGQSVNLADNYLFAKDHGPRFYLKVTPDWIDFITEAAKDAIDIAKDYGPSVASYVAGL